MLNEDIMNSTTYQTYYAYASGAKESIKARKFKKPASPKLKTVLVLPQEPTKKPAKGKKDVSQTRKPATKPKLTKKKAPVKADRGKGLNVLSAVALSETTQLKEAAKQSKKDFHISYASGSGDGTDFESRVPDEQQRKISGTDKGTGTKPGVPDVPKYDSENKNDDDDDEADSDRTESDRSKIPDLNKSNEEHEEHEEAEEENIDERVHTLEDYELTDEEENDNNAKEENEEKQDDTEELYRDVNVNLRKEDVEMNEADQGRADQHNVSQESGFEQLLNFENTSPADNMIASLTDTTVRHEEPSSQTSFLFIVPVTIIPEITYAFTTTIHPQPPSFNPLPQQATPTPTPTASEATNSFLALPDF
ncbi:hypothetical protein Tco_0948002 [Tanacetum coccineum]